jgi:hypothetical protein
MMNLMHAQASAQLISLIVFAAIAKWYLVPWLHELSRAESLTALLWVHVFRYVALQVFSAPAKRISDFGCWGGRDRVG